MADFDQQENNYVPEFDSVDLNKYTFTSSIEQLPGRSFMANVVNKTDDEDSFEIALPKFFIEDKINISFAGVNGFFVIDMDTTESSHLNFINWTKTLDTWIVNQVTENHKNWFGHMWNEHDPLCNTPYPSKTIIENMFKETIDEEYKLTLRVHKKKEKFNIQCMDENQNEISIEEISNCFFVPLVEINGVFFKSNGYHIDWVLRGIVKLDEKQIDDNIEYKLFHTENSEEDAEYPDYATDDDTASEVSMMDDIETLQELQDFQNDDTKNFVQQTMSEDNEKKLKELMEQVEKTKNDAQNAQLALNSFKTNQPIL